MMRKNVVIERRTEIQHPKERGIALDYFNTGRTYNEALSGTERVFLPIGGLRDIGQMNSS
jgi:hypothetical protein